MIWLIGNKGMLGTELSRLFEARGLKFIGTDRELDILDISALYDFAVHKDIEWIVNCAAYTAVDKAESDAELCEKLNVRGPENIGKVAERVGASSIHISTDYVFSGTGNAPYKEDDPIGPTGVYGRTKAQGESAFLSSCSRAIIVRTAWLYGKYGSNFVITMLRLMKERESVGIVTDQHGSPTWAYDLSDTIARILDLNSRAYGIYHYTNEGVISWFEFATEIYNLGREYGLLDHEVFLRPLTTDEYPTKARRPAYSALSKEKIKNTFHLLIPQWGESLEEFFAKDIAGLKF